MNVPVVVLDARSRCALLLRLCVSPLLVLAVGSVFGLDHGGGAGHLLPVKVLQRKYDMMEDVYGKKYARNKTR